MIENPIEYNGMFATPEDVEALLQYCERFSGGARVAALVVAGMALNLAHKMVQDKINQGESK